MNRMAKWLVKHRVVVVIICLLLMIPSIMGMTATKVKYDLLYYLPQDLDTVKGQEILMEDFGKPKMKSLYSLASIFDRIWFAEAQIFWASCCLFMTYCPFFHLHLSTETEVIARSHCLGEIQ